MKRPGQMICLTMIVKDEAAVIRRCLDSIRPVIDRWVIVDTGSTDGTREIVRGHLAGLPGRLVERPWVDFAHNRTEAIELARDHSADYLMVIDADEVLELDPGFVVPSLDADSYNAKIHYGGCRYLRKVLIRAGLPWRYRGVVHEYLECPEARTEGFLPGLRTRAHRDGARAQDPQTYRRDALAIERALLDEPDNRRYEFYLAQSYRDAGELELAIRHYQRRAEMGGWHEEVWFALYQAAQLKGRLGEPWPEVLEAYLAAHEYMPDRAEPMFRIGTHYQRLGRHRSAHRFLARAIDVPRPASERLFVEQPLYDYGIALEFAVAAHYAGDFAAAIETNTSLLRSGLLPPGLVARVVHNRRFSIDAATAARKPAEPPPLTVLVTCGQPGPELDDCIASLSAADLDEFRVVVAAPGADLEDRLPAGDPRFEPRAETAIAALAAERPDDAILPLTGSDALTSPGALRRILDAFTDAGCLAVYAQHRPPDGRLGAAEPAPDAERFQARGPALTAGSPLAFRGRLLMPPPSDGEDPCEVVWRRAGFAGIRFLDEPLISFAETPRRQSRRHPVAAMPGEPKVSCLMVTGSRVARAKRAIRSFAEQTYASRELVVVTDADERVYRALERYADALGLDDVRFVVLDGGSHPLGRLRNASLDAARGEVVCQWDDDDYSHPARVERQLAHLRATGAGACCLTDHLHLHEERRTLCWVDWSVGGRITGPAGLAPGSLMMEAGLDVRYPERGPYARRGEDSVLLTSLDRHAPIAALAGAGHLWLYTHHGANTFPKEHHQRLSFVRGLRRQQLSEREAEIRAAVSHYPVPRPAVVAGPDGPAFVV